MVTLLNNTYTARPVCWNGWISDSYCSLKPLCSGMGEVVPARTSPTLLPHPLALCCHCPVSKCRSASIVVTSTVRDNIVLQYYDTLYHDLDCVWVNALQHIHFYCQHCGDLAYNVLTLTVLVTTIDALQHFETG